MRRTMFPCLLVTSVLLIAACSESPPPGNTQPTAWQNSVRVPPTKPEAPPERKPEPEVQTDRFSGVVEPDIELNANWLVLEGEVGEYGPAIGIRDGKKYGLHHLWEIRDEIDAYLKREDDDAGLPGVVDTGHDFAISRNPVVFRCAPRESSAVFDMLINRLGIATSIGELILAMPTNAGEMRVRHSVQIIDRDLDFGEPPPPEQPPDRPVEYPRDEPAKPKKDPAPPAIEDLYDWQKDYITLRPVYDSKKEVFGLRTLWAKRPVEHTATGFKPANVCGDDGKFDQSEYRALRTKLAEAMLDRVGQSGDAVWDARAGVTGTCISTKNAPEDKFVPWLVVFAQVDAIRVLNESGELPVRQLRTRFANALD